MDRAPGDARSGGVAGALLAALLLASAAKASATPRYAWLDDVARHGSLGERIEPPPGYERIPATEPSFAFWLRNLPLREPGASARLFDGRNKRNQEGAFAVVDLDVGSRDLQQCVDAVIRLRAEYLWASGCADAIAFDFTSGHAARWTDWRAGRRPVVAGRDVSWRRRSAPDSSYRSFRRYLDTVFTYAGSLSLARELEAVTDPSAVLPGDVFVQGGSPGHAVLVVDVAKDVRGGRVFLLVQSYMPAQDVHVLVNPATPGSPWYPALDRGQFVTPDWRFSCTDLRRFPGPDCTAHDRGPGARP